MGLSSSRASPHAMISVVKYELHPKSFTMIDSGIPVTMEGGGVEGEGGQGTGMMLGC